MPKAILALVVVAFLSAAAPADARGHHSYSSHHHERYHRSSEAKHEFEAATGHPHGWPGHVVDHIVPLACGGADSPNNMQWQTVADAKAKDKWERKGCH